MKTVSTKQALATAFAAYRINNGYNKHTRRFSEANNKTVFANKELVKFSFDDRYAPDDFVSFAVTDADVENAEHALDHFKKYTLQLLGDDLSQFQRDIFALVSEEEMETYKLGLMSYVPEMVMRDIEESKLKKMLRTEYRNSQHLAQIGDKVEGTVCVLSAFYSERYERYFYEASLDKNVVAFSSGHKLRVGDTKRIKARVKDHTRNRKFSVNETRLNYVRLYTV